MKTKIIYWATTGLFSLMMLFSAYKYFTSPDMEAAFQYLGFPAYFRIELAVAKVLGVIALLIPAIPIAFKQFAYAGFFINLVSASIAHGSKGDPAQLVLTPMVFLVFLIVSYLYYQKLYSHQLRQVAI